MEKCMQDGATSDFSFYVTPFRGEEILKLSKHTAPCIVYETGFNLAS